MMDEWVFGKEHFLDGIKTYPWHGGVYNSLSTAPIHTDRVRQSQLIVGVLRNWGGLRTSSAGLTDSHAGELIDSFMEEQERELAELECARLEDLTSAQIALFGKLLGDLRTRGGRPHLPLVGAGKLLHFLLPNSAMIWDNLYVRGPLLLQEEFDSEGDQYMALLRFGRRLLAYIRAHEGPQSLEEIRSNHEAVTNCRGSLPKLIDELFYDRRGNRERAILALGGLGPALAPD